jgi:Pvc16 N-terminal domain
MSNFLAIATVTAALKRVLQDAATQAVAGALVRPGRPEAPANGNAQAPGIDLYLYQVTPNAALRNDDLPTRRADGTFVQRPKVALDLHYLLAFRGDESALEPQRLLGNAARALHASPVITSSLIGLAQADFAFLAASDLADAVELVKLAPLSLSLEELSKLWSVFFQIPYNLSVAYQATVVVIEGEETPQSALPVLERRLYVHPFQNAFITEVASALGPGQPIVAGGTLVLRGRGLRHDPMHVVVRGTVVPPSFATDAEVGVPLTSPPFPAGSLRAGVQGVAVVHPVLMGMPPIEHAGFESNVAAFVLRPRIVASAAPTSNQVDVTVDPPVGKGQRAVLLLNHLPGFPPSAHVFTNPPAPADTATPSFAVSGVGAGGYFVRVQVDGAESPVVLDATNPAFGPTVSIP